MSSPPLRIHLFGPMRVFVGGEPMARVRTRSIEWLLALLALRHGRAVSRSWLAGTLWPESEEHQALQNLRHDLVYLRKALGPEAVRIQSPSRDLLALDLVGADIDVVEFDCSIGADDEDSLRRAVGLSALPLLEGCYEEWVVTEREMRSRQCLEALEKLADRARERGRSEEAVRYLQQAELLDPLRESATRRLMAALESSGDSAAALEAYRRLRERLHADLSAAPDEATTSLFRDIRARARERTALDPPARPGVRHPSMKPREEAHSPLIRPPHPLTPLIGRDEEAQAVRERLSQSRLITLVGAGGVGKTRLAMEVASLAGEDVDDGAAWVELGPLVDETLVLSTIAAALGIRDGSGEAGTALPARIGARLAGHSALLVLDNCEHLIEAAAVAAETLLHTAPGLRILATSRERLGLHGETVWQVPSLALPSGNDLPPDERAAIDRALESPAVRLFVERAQAAQSRFCVRSRDDAASVCMICRRLDGIPLAIELAAARIDSFTPQEIMARLDNRFGLLTRGARTAPPRHRTLRGLIDWSYELLTPPERAMLERLSVFAGGWTIETAEAVCSDETASPDLQADLHSPTLDLLTSLAARSLIVAEPGATETRYRMLETVREYARERLDETGAQDYWRARHLSCLTALAEEAGPRLTGPESARWLGRLDAEYDNLRAALGWALAPHDDRTANEERIAEAGQRLAVALSVFWQIRGYLAEGRRWLAAACLRAGEESRTLRARATVAAGVLAQIEGDCEGARTLLEEGLSIARDLGDRREMAAALRGLGNVARTIGDYPRAAAHYEEVLRINRELGDPRAAARSLQNLGLVARERGQLESAERLYSEALEMLREAGDKPAIALTLNSLGVVAFDQRDFARAKAFYGQALDLGRELGEHVTLTASLHNLGMVAFAAGDPEAARTYYEEALALNRAAGNRAFEAANLEGLGVLAASQGALAEAEPVLSEALSIRRDLDLRPGIAASLEAISSLAFKQGMLDRGARLWGAAQVLREAIHCPITSARLSEYESDLSRARSVLGEVAFEDAQEVGRSLATDEAIDYALSPS